MAASDVVAINDPLMVITGAILFVFAFESLVRVLGYRMALVNGTRIYTYIEIVIEQVDIFVVWLSIIVFVSLAASAGASSAAKVIIASRVSVVIYVYS